ncbi:MAG: hypothetical protein FWB98_03595 [Defluviitaleaceae bacterium]|nr:hypothetical protein [Defluviitaleaceae bacterium]
MIDKDNNEMISIEELLADLPDHDLPGGLRAKIMQDVRVVRRKKSALQFVKSFGAGSAAVLVLVLWFVWWTSALPEAPSGAEPAAFASGEVSHLSRSWVGDDFNDFVTTTLWVEDFAPSIAEIESLPEGTATIAAEGDDPEQLVITIQITDDNFLLIQQTLQNMDIYLGIEPDTEISILLIKIQ